MQVLTTSEYVLRRLRPQQQQGPEQQQLMGSQ
eukprot:COSAG05_NODE_1523_length_4641_cov_5.853589_3_plen_32_part_00